MVFDEDPIKDDCELYKVEVLRNSIWAPISFIDIKACDIFKISTIAGKPVKNAMGYHIFKANDDSYHFDGYGVSIVHYTIGRLPEWLKGAGC